MEPIIYIDRVDGKKKIESVYGGSAIAYLYGPRVIGKILGKLSATLPFISAFYGWYQKCAWSKKKSYLLSNAFK